MTQVRTIVADPPWLERGAGQCKRGADRHYPLMPTDAIIKLMREVLFMRVEPHAHLYMWVTNNYLPDGLLVGNALGFRYVTNLCWVKDRAGLGQYWRGQHELLLFFVCGRGLDVVTESRSLTTVIDDASVYGAPRGAHSAKPHLFHELVEARSKGPYLEIFARERRAGWEAFGNDPALAVAP